MVAAFLMVVAAFLVISFAPAAWMQRMGNLAEGKLDRSAQERLFTWRFAANFAKSYPVTGGGFDVFNDGDIKIKYSPAPSQAELEEWRRDRSYDGGIPDYLVRCSPHSSYFQVLAEQGYTGLALFLILLGSCFLTLRKLRRIGKRDSQFEWLAQYAGMLQLSFAAYSVSGAFLGRAYFDLYFTLIACTILLTVFYRQQLRDAVVRPDEVNLELQPELA
jgi:probable O-glycosylation ligase (exosortase A-associated)